MLTPSLRKPSRNFRPIVPEAASKHATAELWCFSTAANDLAIGGPRCIGSFPTSITLGFSRGQAPKLIGQLAAEESVIALAQVEPELLQYEPRSETHSSRFRQRNWLSAAEQHKARTPALSNPLARRRFRAWLSRRGAAFRILAGRPRNQASDRGLRGCNG